MNAKTTRRALLSSVMALVLCVTMLMGTTFAWFTDTATVKVNTIQSGTLDIDLIDKNNQSLEGKTIGFKTADGRAQDKILWEPGCTYELDEVNLINNGNLHAKFLVTISAVNGANDGDIDLAEVIDVYEGEVKPENKIGTLRDILKSGMAVKEGNIAPNGEEVLSFGKISLHMQETAGNDYQNKSITNIAITVYATQYTAEYDSVNNTYDENAEYEIRLTEETARAFLDNGGVVDFNGAYMFNEIVGDNNYGANLREYTFKAGTTVKNLTLKGNSGATRWLHTEGDVTFENVTFDAPVYSCHFDSGKGSLKFINCTFIGWNAIGGDYDNVYFENCEFYHSGRNGMARIYTDTQFVNCTFGDGMNIETGKGGLAFTITDCSYNDGEVKFYQSEGSTITYN